MFNILEGLQTVILVNARHIKAVPGRKTDVRDCEWLADLLRHGLLKANLSRHPRSGNFVKLSYLRQSRRFVYEPPKAV